MFHRASCLCIIAIVVAGCARAPEDIQARSVDDAEFRKMSCAKLAEEKKTLDTYYAQAAESQRNARTRDTLGIMRFGVPISTATRHNVSKYIARNKGEQAAIQRVMAEKNCQ